MRPVFIALLAAAAALAGCAAPAPEPAARGDVLLVILDTVRADHLSAYGYSRPTTPALERLAAEGQRYDDAWAQSPWTLPSIATLLTGVPPRTHGATRGARGVHAISDAVPTLAERLRDAGWATGAFVNVLWCSPEISGLDRGFERYDHHGSDESNLGHRDAAATTDAVLAWLDGLGRRRFFAVVHYFDAHLTYDPPAPFDTMFEAGEGPTVPRGFGSAAQVFAVRDGRLPLAPAERASLIARYDGEIRFVDEQLGRLREGLERRGRWDDALVVVVADHGEEFWDHGGFEHGHSHHRELLRAPLIVRRPGAPAGAVVGRRVRQIDVAPTVLDFAGLAPDEALPGFPLGTRHAPHAVAEGSLWAGDLVSVRADTGTLIWRRDRGDAVFFAPDDLLEQRPLPPDSAAARELLDLLRALPAADAAGAPARELDEEQLERLRSLGYVR